MVVCLGMVELLLLGVIICVDYYYFYYVGGGIELGDMLFDVVDEFGMCFVFCCGGVIELVSSYLGFFKMVLQFEMFDQMLVDIEWFKYCYYDDVFDVMCCVVVVLIILMFLLLLVLLVELVCVVWGMYLCMYMYLFEIDNYVCFCWEKYNCLLVEFVVEYEWFGLDVWFVYFVYLQLLEICMFV